MVALYLYPLYMTTWVVPLSAGQLQSPATPSLLPAAPACGDGDAPPTMVAADELAKAVLVEDAVSKDVAVSVPEAPPLSQLVDQDVPGSVLVHSVVKPPS